MPAFVFFQNFLFFIFILNLFGTFFPLRREVFFLFFPDFFQFDRDDWLRRRRLRKEDGDLLVNSGA